MVTIAMIGGCHDGSPEPVMRATVVVVMVMVVLVV